MDRKAILGFVLIGLIFSGWLWYQSISFREIKQPKPTSTVPKDSVPAESLTQTKDSSSPPEPTRSTFGISSSNPDSVDLARKTGEFGSLFAPFAERIPQTYSIQTDLATYRLSSKGGAFTAILLKKYKTWYKTDVVNLIKKDGREFTIRFVSSEDRVIDTKDLDYTISSATGEFKVSGNDSLVVTAVLSPKSGSAIRKRFVFHGNKYGISADVTMENMEPIFQSSKQRYEVMWKRALRFQEENSVDESGNSHALMSVNGEVTELDATSAEEKFNLDLTGSIDFIGAKNKYFGLALIQQTPMPDAEAHLEGKHFAKPNDGQVEEYSLRYQFPYRGGSQTQKLTIFAGPLDYKLAGEYGLKEMINFGWRLVVRPIGEWFMLPVFTWIHGFVANWGIVIIIFSILMKIVLTPLSLGQMKSAQKMKLLTPQITAIREKYKDDQMKQGQETMALYSEYGINPAGGCLPLLLQMPVLYALYAVLSNAIQLRQTPFIPGWIYDLSVPDSIVSFGFKVPIFGADHLSGLALVMGITMFIQQKMSVQDPRQKQMMYIMPVMMTLMFANLPAGLNLYYFMFNLLSIAHQYYLNNFAKNQPTLADLKKMPKKESWLQKKLQSAQEMANQSGKSVPGQYSSKKRPSGDSGKKGKK